MAPQSDYDEGTSFYGAVEIAPKMEEGKNNQSKTLKLLVGLAFIAVALTAAVFAFTSPVATHSVGSAVDIDFPHFEEQTCFCESNCVNEPGYGNEGVCVVKDHFEADGITPADCVDFLGQTAATCDATQQGLLGVSGAEKCGSCDMVVGQNSCWSNPCMNGALCADRAMKVSDSAGAGSDPDKLGYYCHCPFGYSGVQCQTKVDFCANPLTFCDNGKKDHPCESEADCLFVFKAGADVASSCVVDAVQVCDEAATCISDERKYECKCKDGYEGDGYQTDQNNVAFASVLSQQCATVKSMHLQLSVDQSTLSADGWLDRSCTGTTTEYARAGCRNIDGCTIKEQVVTPGHTVGGCLNSATCQDTYSDYIFNSLTVKGTGEPNSYECTCPTTPRGSTQEFIWKGDKCEEDVDECIADGVATGICGLNAICNNLSPLKVDNARADNGYECTCNVGWVSSGYGTSGDELNNFKPCVDEDDCATNPCSNGATCANNGDGTGDYTCTCALGWSGTTCTVDINECDRGGLGYETCKALEHMVCVNENAKNDGTAETLKGNTQGWKCECAEYWAWNGDITDAELLSGSNGERSCVDYDDCTTIPPRCSNAATCTNVGKSKALDWTCVCPSGWEGRNCDEDINECEFVHTVAGTEDSAGNKVIDTASEVIRMHDCLDDAQCQNVDGGWECHCWDGYFGNGKNFCHDIDDCARHQKVDHFCTSDMQECSGEGDTSCGGACVYTDGDIKTVTRCASAQDCFDNVELKKVFPAAADATAYTCDEVQKCTADPKLTRDAYPRTSSAVFADHKVTVTAGYTAQTIFLSPAPWVMDKKVYDEAGEDKVHQCGYLRAAVEGSTTTRPSWYSTGTCVDTGVNSFQCECNEGWTDSNCDVDVADCELDIDNCDRNADCKETDGSFLCTCKFGYEDALPQCRPDNVQSVGFDLSSCGISCSDIDDCIGPDARCAHGVCRDLGAMAYKCTCNEGYTDFKCDADINECGLMTDDCDERFGICTNTPGSWTCKCKDGFIGTGKKGTCEEIDDCAQSPCEHGECKDTGNSYVCECEVGWKDKHCDHDLNECQAQSSASHGCHEAGKCVNTPGSYYCRCVSGFQGDGYVCTDLDDCDPDPCDVDTSETIKCRAWGVEKPTGMYSCYDEAGEPVPSSSLHCEDTGANEYQCRVCPGYSGGVAPSNINECLDNTHECAVSATCLDTEGSYECTCAAAHYDPCVCPTDVTLDGMLASNQCPVCRTAVGGEVCKPGRECVECTDCKAGADTDSTKYACPADPKLSARNPSAEYFPFDPQFNGGKPTNPGRSTGKGFKKLQGSTCISSDLTCVNINECTDMIRSDIVQYNGLKCGEAGVADCIDECGTARCECWGLVPDCKADDACYHGDGETCTKCTVCGVHECEVDGPTSTSDRTCAPLIKDGRFAMETWSGHTAQCLVMWKESQKVFPERYNWGGKPTGANGGATSGTDAAELCENPVCGVCGSGGKTAEQDIISGGAAVWAFRHLKGEEYLIMADRKGAGYRCLGFRAPGAPYPELISWEEEIVEDARGECDIGQCDTGNGDVPGKMCTSDANCGEMRKGNTGKCIKKTCGNVDDCPVPDMCIGATNLGSICIKDAEEGHKVGDPLTWVEAPKEQCGGTQGSSLNAECVTGQGLTEAGAQCDLATDATCLKPRGRCLKERSTTGMWVNTAPKTIWTKTSENSWSDYNCGMDSQSVVQTKSAVVWKITALGQVKAGAQICESEKKCSLAKYKGMFVIESKAKNDKEYECLHFKDGDFSMNANPSLVVLGEAGYGGSSSKCHITVGAETEDQALIAQKGSVWKLLSLDQ